MTCSYKNFGLYAPIMSAIDLTKYRCRHRLNSEQVKKVYDAWRGYIPVKVCMRAFSGIVFGNPFTITLGKKNGPCLSPSANTELIIRKYWKVWQNKVYFWKKLLGVVPYYYKIIDSGDAVPIVPPLFSGRIETYLNEENEQKFLWFWEYHNPNGELTDPDLSMHWIVDEFEAPNEFGELSTAMYAFARVFHSLDSVRNDIAYGSYHSVRPFYTKTSRPPNGSDDSLDKLETPFGEAATGMVEAFTHNRKMEMNKKDRKAHEKAVLETQIKNMLRNMSNGNIPKAVHEEKKEKIINFMTPPWQMDTNNKKLDPYEQYNVTNGISAIHNPAEDFRRLDEVSSAAVDFPIEFIMSTHAQRSANVDGMLRFLNERIKTTCQEFSSYIKDAWAFAYGNVHTRAKRSARRRLREHVLSSYEKDEKMLSSRLREINKACECFEDVTVKLPCTPLISYAQLRSFFEDKILEHEDFAKFALQITGIPDSFRMSEKEAQKELNDEKRRAGEASQEEPEKKRAKTEEKKEVTKSISKSEASNQPGSV